MTGEEFRKDRENLGLSQKGMAERLKVTEDVIRTIEAGRMPRPAGRLAIAAHYGKTVLEIWPLEDRKAEAA